MLVIGVCDSERGQVAIALGLRGNEKLFGHRR